MFCIVFVQIETNFQNLENASCKGWKQSRNDFGEISDISEFFIADRLFFVLVLKDYCPNLYFCVFVSVFLIVFLFARRRRFYTGFTIEPGEVHI